MLLPAASILTAAGVREVLDSSRSVAPETFGRIVVLIVAMMMVEGPLRDVRGVLRYPWRAPAYTHRDEAVDYVRRHTRERDHVLVWGAESAVNFLSRRESPTRYVYQYPLLTEGYVTEDRIEEFLRGVRANPPVLLLDTSPTNNVIPPLDSEKRGRWRGTEGYRPPDSMARVYDWVAKNYTLVNELPESRWRAYERKDDSP